MVLIVPWYTKQALSEQEIFTATLQQGDANLLPSWDIRDSVQAVSHHCMWERTASWPSRCCLGSTRIRSVIKHVTNNGNSTDLNVSFESLRSFVPSSQILSCICTHLGLGSSDSPQKGALAGVRIAHKPNVGHYLYQSGVHHHNPGTEKRLPEINTLVVYSSPETSPIAANGFSLVWNCACLSTSQDFESHWTHLSRRSIEIACGW